MLNKKFNVADPDPQDPYVFGPHGSGSLCLRYGSANLVRKAKLVRKTLIPTVCDLFMTFYLWKIMKTYLQKVG